MSSFDPETMPETVIFIEPIKVQQADKLETFLNRI